MIRHSSSLFLSIIFHTLLAFSVFLAYKTIFLVEQKEEKEKLLKVQLCHIQTPVKKVLKKLKPVEKKTKPLVKKKPLKKKIIKPKPIVKKIPPNSSPSPEIVKESKPKIISTPKIIEQVIIKKKSVVLETKEEKNKRLQKQYIDNNIQKISELLTDNLYYPRSARKRGITGVVLVQFKLSISATVHEISILSSNNEILSRSAIKTIENLSGEFPKPKEELLLHVPIEYTLRR